MSHVIGIVVVAQVVLVLVVVAVSIPITGRLHDAVPSTIRAGVASGVGTLTWLTFLPFAFVFGAVSDRSGVDDAGWTARARGRAHGHPCWAGRSVASCAPRRAYPWSRRSRPTSSGRMTTPSGRATGSIRPGRGSSCGVQIDTDAAVAEVREAITDLPSPQHEVIVARDVEGRAPADVREELDLSPSEERDLLNQARGRLRAGLDDYLKERGA